MSKSSKSVKRQPRRNAIPRKQLVVIEPEKKARKTYRRTYKSYAKAEKDPGVISGLGRLAGGALGSTFGPAGTGVGAFLGGKLGHLIETVTGFGDYQIQQNSIMKGGMTIPQIVNSAETGGVIIRHREYLGDIAASTAFTIQSYDIQPGLQRTFPWLSSIANSFEQYRIRGMLFEFNSTSADAVYSVGANTALGSVIMMTDYDIADAPPTSKREMLNSEWSSSSKPACTFIHPIECKKSMTPQTMMYTRGTILPPTGYDPRLYDFARFHIATEGMQAAGGIIGELWVTYEIELFKSQFAFFGLSDHLRLVSITNLLPFGVQAQPNAARTGSTLGGTITSNSLSYAFPPTVSSGKYLFTYSVVGGGGPSVSMPNYSFTNATSIGLFVNNTLGSVDAPEPPIVPNQAVAMITMVVQVLGQNALVTFATDGVLPGAVNYGDLWVVRVADSITF